MADEDTLYEEGDPQDVTGSTAPRAFSADDVASWGQPTEQHAYGAEDVSDWGTPEEVHASEWGSFARRAVREAPIGAAAGAAGVLASIPGAAAGALTSPVTGPVGPVVGGLATGVPAAMGTSYLLHKGEDWVLDKLGLSEGTGFFSKAQELADRMENPKSTFAGDLAGNTLPAFGTGIGKGGAMIGQRVLGGGLQAGMEAGQEVYRGEDLDPAKLAMSTAAGALFAKPRSWVDAITPSGGSNPPRPHAPGGPKPEPGLGGPTRDFKGDTPLNGEVLPADPHAITYDNTGKWARDIESAIEQRDVFDKSDPMWQFWHDYIGQLQSREDGKGGVDVDASLGPASDEHPFTYQMANRANDATTVSAGIAHENPPAPQVEGAGNPVGAPMEARIAQRPTGLLRDYRKTASPEGTGIVTQESTRISQAPLHEDVAAALKGEQPETAPSEKNVGGAPAEPTSTLPATEPAPRPTAPGKPVTEAVTPLAPHEQRVLDTARQQLQEAGMQRVLERLDAMPPQQAAQAATQLLQALGSKTGEATGAGSPGEIRMPSKRPEVASGMTARSKADAARKQGVLNAYDQAVEKFGKGPENEEQGALLDRLKNLVNTADQLSGGATYRPNVKPPAWSLVKAARVTLAKPTPKNIEAYRQAEAVVAGKDEGKNLEQETARIESDIEKRPQISEEASEALINQNASDKGRPDHELFSNDKGEESAVYTGQHNALTNWLNSLSDASHAMLMKVHPDIETDVKTTQDPHELKNVYMNDLAEAQRKAASFEAAPAENMPVVKRTAVRSRDDLMPTEPGAAASPGRSLDRNSDEFKRLAAQYGKAAPKKATYDLAHEEAQLKPVDGTEKSAVEHFMDMMADESGAARTNDLYDWMKQKATDFFSPAAADPIKEYGKALGFGFTRLSNRLTQFKSSILANARSAQFPDGTKPNAAEKGQIYRAWERGETGLLPAKLKGYYDEFVKPLEQKYGPMYDEYRQMAIGLGVVPFEELPVRKNNGNGFMQWVPRVQKGKHAWDAANDDNVDPVSGQTLSHWAETTQMRDWFTLQNTRGDRFTYIPGDGFITRMTNGAPGRIKVTSNSFDPREIGSTIKLKRGGREDMWTVDHATIDEITQAGGKNTDGTPKLQYHDSPVIAMTNAVYGLNNALERLRLYRDVVNSPEFQANSTKSKKEASENGWIESKLPQFDGKYMPEAWAWTMDDFFKSGFDFGSGSVGRTWNALQRFTGATAKLFYFFGPLVHGLNEMDKWAIGRGYNWVTPGGWKSLVVDGNTALKSVWRQDAIQREMTEAGANPMLTHTLTRNLMQKVARSTGDNIAANPAKWDPFARAFGISTKELASSAYEKSSALMWWMSDVMLTQRYLEEKRLRGLSPKEAVASAHDFIDSYKVPPTIAEGALGKGGGRLARQFVTDPATSLFGPYHYGVFHTFGNMISKLLGPQATKQERVRAAGQWAVAAAMMYAVYPALSAVYGKITGNDKSEVERRGLSRLMGTAGELAEGEKGAVDLLRNLWTPSAIADTTIREIQGKDWRGKDIMDQQNFTDEPVKKGLRAAGQQAEFLAGQLVAPYKQLSNGMREPGATPGSVMQKFIEQNSGLKTPSPAAERFNAQREKRQHAISKARVKRPSGMIEDLMNRLTE